MLFHRYLNVSVDSKLQNDLWNVMSALAKCQYPFYFRMQQHLEPIQDMLPQFAQFNVSHFMMQVAYVSGPGGPHTYEIFVLPLFFTVALI
jgi:hypothetical protein